jgi:hypothetical protein
VLDANRGAADVLRVVAAFARVLCGVRPAAEETAEAMFQNRFPYGVECAITLDNPPATLSQLPCRHCFSLPGGIWRTLSPH